MEGDVRWEEWNTDAARPAHRSGRGKFLLAGLKRVGEVRQVEGRGCPFQEAVGGWPGAGAGRNRRNRNSEFSQSPWAGHAGGNGG